MIRLSNLVIKILDVFLFTIRILLNSRVSTFGNLHSRPTIRILLNSRVSTFGNLYSYF